MLVPRRYHYFPSSAARDARPARHARPSGLGRGRGGGGRPAARCSTRSRTSTPTTSTPRSSDTRRPPPRLRRRDAARVRVGARGAPARARADARLLTRDPSRAAASPEHTRQRMASELGATMESAVGPTVTHVVAGSDQTEKVARACAAHAVSIDWLARAATCGGAQTRARCPSAVSRRATSQSSSSGTGVGAAAAQP